MSELEELPSWAGRSADSGPSEQSVPPIDDIIPPAEADVAEGPRRRRPWRAVLLALLGILALIGIGVVGFLLAGSSDSATETATDDQLGQADEQLGSEELAGSTDEATAAEADAAAGADETVTVDVDETEAAATEADTTDETDAAPAGADDGEVIDSGRQAIFKGGKVYLSGKVPSEEIGQLIEQKAAAVVGPENVVNEYTIDPRAIIEPGSSAPLYVDDVVLFGFNSVAIAEPFLPILDLGTLLLRQNPQASVTVITRTDAVGSEEVNLQVSKERAQAVINYWLSKGVDADQIKADPRGEEMASDDDDEQTAAMNRRAEFIITGLLD